MSDLLTQLAVLDLGAPSAGGSLLVAVDDPVTGRTRAVATAAQQRLLTVRDRRCRMPGCRRRPGRARTDLDHMRAHAAGGPTACWNLCCLCQRHHRIKTLARDWSFTLDGATLVVRTPAGITRRTDPPGWYPHPEPGPPWLDDLAPPDPLRT